MRLVAWNVNHRSHAPKQIPEALTAAIFSFDPDVLVLNEYVEGPGHNAFLAALDAGGLAFTLHTPRLSGHNQVLVASRTALALGALRPPEAVAASNFLHVRTALLEIVGVRVPCYKHLSEKRAYWDWFGPAVRPLLLEHTVILGDLNAGPERAGVGAKHLQALRVDGWQLPVPSGAGSYRGPSGRVWRLDHALASPAVFLSHAAYLWSKPELSDHAALAVEVR